MSEALQSGPPSSALVHVVEDDPDLQDALDALLDAAALPHRMYQRPDQFRQALPLSAGGCLVLDIRLPGISGVELAAEVRRLGIPLPLIMMSAHADMPATIQSFKLGACDFLLKPFQATQFVDAVRQALAKDAERRQAEAQRAAQQRRLSKLTRRDWEVIEMLRRGLPNKRIATSLAITERAVEMRRAALLAKTQSASLPELFELLGQCHGARRPSD